HIVSDGWSMGVLHHELFTLYGAFILGHSSPLSELQQLRAEGEEVPLLFMLDPSEERLEPPGKVKETGLFRLLWSRVQRHLRKLALLGFREKLDYLLPRVKDQINMRILRMMHEINKLMRNAFLAA